MKKLTITIALTTLLSLSVFAHPVDVKTAQKVATTFLNNNGAKSTQLTDISKAAGFPNLYIFTTENSFVVMAADDCAQPILGYSLSDKFIVDDMPENLRWWLQQYSDEIQWGIENGIQPDKSTADEWQDLKEGKNSKDTPTAVVEPLLTTKWDQGSPYNMNCPTGTVTGCVATAMAQVMKYWNYPQQGQGSHTNVNNSTQTINFAEATYDWDKMTNTYTSSSSTEAKQAVAKLMYHCGVSVDMIYGSSSSASSSKVPTSLVEYFRYAPSATYKSIASYTYEQWIALLKSELDESRPVFYHGQNQDGGHAFVCDGYNSNDYFHFNWGWSGYQDDYWLIGALNPLSGGIGSGSGSYNLSNGVALWVEPISSLEAPTILVTTSDDILSLSWDAIEGAISYDIYRDNIKIATNITDNSYVDSDVISGIYYEYYVRAVSGETRSNPSNRVTKMPFLRDYTPADLFVTKTEDLVTLTWTEPTNNSTTLQYATGYNQNRFGMGPNKKDTYWAEVFAPSRLIGFEGMYIEKVSVYCYLDGVYTLMIYEDNCEQETNKLCEQTISVASRGWGDIVLTTPIPLDCTKELWIIMHYPYTPGSEETYSYPATTGNYDEIPYTENEEDEYFEERYNPRLIGESLTEPWYYLDYNYSWLMRTYISDGTYTYNIYDGETKLNSETVTGSSYTHENPANNTIHEYTVTTNYFGGESSPSNTAVLALGTASIASLELDENNTMTVAPNSTLTVTGTLSNDNPENLILENGAQLFHSGSDVYATVKKDIAAYTTEKNGWNFIASPIATQLETATIEGLIPENEETTFDLYKYNEPNHKWYNYKPETDNAEPSFAIDPKTGYLYASSENTTLSFAGKLHSASSSISSNTLSYSADVLKGFNLVGNPFVCNATLEGDFYVINDTTNNVILAQTGRQIAPCESVFVQATEANQTVTFSKAGASKGGVSTGSTATIFDLVVTQGKITLDRARVRFGEGTNMEKFTLEGRESTQLTLWHDGQDYAVAYTNGQSEMPLNFKAVENGTYSIGIESNSLDLDYLHLIDNMTGDDVDLLALEPVEGPASYTFEAKTTDYASRFRLVFAPNCGDAVGDDGAFAYVSNGEIVVVGNADGDAGTASLQVVDMTGRVVVSVGGHTRCVPTTGMPTGVYVLRLIDGDNVRTQKIVIE